MSKANELCWNYINFLPNPGPLSFGLGPQSFYIRGTACSWWKNVSLYPWNCLQRLSAEDKSRIQPIKMCLQSWWRVMLYVLVNNFSVTSKLSWVVSGKHEDKCLISCSELHGILWNTIIASISNWINYPKTALPKIFRAVLETLIFLFGLVQTGSQIHIIINIVSLFW